MDTRLQLVEEIRQYVYQHGLDSTVARYRDTLASWPGEAAGIWLRVSSADQSEANQLPDVLRRCAERGYRPATWYVLHDKSAFKGEQDAKLDEMLADVREGTITVSVCWHGDRMERRGGLDLLKILADVKDAGGRVESVQQRDLGLETMGDRISSFMEGEMAREKITHLTEQVKLAHNRIRANSAVGPGSAPWGLDIVGDKYEKKLIPTDLCREYVPQIFARCIAGESCQTIAKWLDAEGVLPKRGAKWHQGSVLKILHNMAYAGRWQDTDRRQTLVHCVAVISLATFNRAQEALATRPKRGPVRKDNRPMLANLRCARCADNGFDSPMFRIRLKSYSGRYYWYYRCTGRGPNTTDLRRVGSYEARIRVLPGCGGAPDPGFVPLRRACRARQGRAVAR
jgi:DNA invertase Pin-like site-specific DNA recombinase